MKRPCLILILVLFNFTSVCAQNSDRSLMETVRFRNSTSAVTDSAGFCVRTARALKDQMVGDCYFVPDCPVFFHESVKKYGFLRSLVFMSDRILRCNRVGMAGHYFLEPDRKIHEGPEAYMPGRKRRK